MELFGRISSKVLQERGGHEMLSVRLSKLVNLCQEFVCSVRINKPEWAWTEQTVIPYSLLQWMWVYMYVAAYLLTPMVICNANTTEKKSG